MVLATKSKPRISRTHRKRVGQHHRHTKHYVKAYHPYIPIVIVIGLGLLLNAFWGHSSPRVLGADTSAWSQILLQSTNQQRENDSENELSVNQNLTSAAQSKADDMIVKNYWSHNAPNGKTPWAFMTDAGYKFEAAGENLAYGFTSGSETVTAWMNSPGHRANILNGEFTQVGFGIAHSNNFNGTGPADVIVAMYAEPAVANAIDSTQMHGVLSDNLNTNFVSDSQSVSRASVLSNSFSGILFMFAAMAACGLLWLITRHALAWQRVMVHSEEFVLKHRLFDVIIVSLTCLVFVLTRTTGFIS